MIKTQIQLPDKLYQELKQVAAEKEWSLAETLRRGAEFLLQVYPARQPRSQPWKPPTPHRLGWRGLTHAQVRQAALADMEPEMTVKTSQ